jgi:Protein of unknown function (DUF616)
MYDIAIITAIYDNYDTLKPTLPQTGAKVEWVYVTDSIDALKAGLGANEGYTLHHQPRDGLHPNRAAKFPKMLPWEYTNADCSIWIDASFRVDSPHFAMDILRMFLGTFDIAQFAHPWRNCVYEEASETLKLPRYTDVHDVIPKQMDRYRNMLSHPDAWGLWATGVIARNHTNTIRNFGELWLNENLGYSYQDQLSEAPMLKLIDERPQSLPGTHFSNPWLSYEASGRHA